jgi:hypothetical protein
MRRRRGDGGSKNSGEDNEDSLSPTLAELAIARSALNIVKMDARSGLFMRFWNH